jgi:hypothetical protein
MQNQVGNDGGYGAQSTDKAYPPTSAAAPAPRPSLPLSDTDILVPRGPSAATGAGCIQPTGYLRYFILRQYQQFNVSLVLHNESISKKILHRLNEKNPNLLRGQSTYYKENPTPNHACCCLLGVALSLLYGNWHTDASAV